MSDEVKHATDSTQQASPAGDASAQPEPRPWVKPTFERADMKDAMGSQNVTNLTQDAANALSS